MPPRPIPGPVRPRTRARRRVPGGRPLPRARRPGPAFCAVRTKGPGGATAPPFPPAGRALAVEGTDAAFCAFRTNARDGGDAVACAASGWPGAARRPGPAAAVRAIRTNRRGDAAAPRFAPFGRNAGAGRRGGASSALRADAQGRGRGRAASCARGVEAGRGAARLGVSAFSGGWKVCGIGGAPFGAPGMDVRAARSVCRDRRRGGSACRSPGLFSYIAGAASSIPGGRSARWPRPPWLAARLRAGCG